MKVTRAFVEAFDLVHAAFKSTLAEIAAAREVVRADYPTAEASYFCSAAMIRAGWKPLEEQASAFIARTTDREALRLFAQEGGTRDA